ncbi:MAG: STAS domain-containing protein [Planctomycetaceae bacterium]|nr:STAS domain-containing protein [Planctomycetaceae bacterium]
MFGSFESHYFTFEAVESIIVGRCILSNLSDEENIEAVGQELMTLIDKYECRELILDLVNVEYMNSSMVGKMIRAHRQLHRDGGKLVICNLNPTVHEILSTSHLLTYFNTATNIPAAATLFDSIQEDDDNDDPDNPNLMDTVDDI